ncbi:hypothetical protein [Nonomuraea sp. NPDC049709]|uniref:hypothetical protein n=1 Tax=Nonomuraea sp. NPDC049709 TaxID=3154736 RepID=UPI003433504E
MQLRDEFSQLKRQLKVAQKQEAQAGRELEGMIVVYANQIQALALKVDELESHNRLLREQLEHAQPTVSRLDQGK